MAYEVTKVVNGRPYRYSVRSERDPDSGKTRNRWTYLGRGEGGRAPVAAKPRANAREALLDALERLLDLSDLGEVTAAEVSIEAGLAHGTFYRYFRNRNDAIHGLVDRLRSNRAAALGGIEVPPADATAGRLALRAWTEALLRAKTQHYGLVRALMALSARDEEMRTALRDRRYRFAERLAVWLRDLADRGFVALPDPEATSRVLFSMLDGIGREAIAAGEPLDAAQITAAVDLVERAVFGALT